MLHLITNKTKTAISAMTANKMLNKDDVIKNDYAITKYVINKKINNNFVFPNTPAQLTLDDTCLLKFEPSLGAGSNLKTIKDS